MKRRPTSILTTLAVSVLALTLIAPRAFGQDPEPITEIRIRAEQGDAEAQYILGYRYATGIGVSQDRAEAARWLRLAAAAGHIQAGDFLGSMPIRPVGLTDQGNTEVVTALPSAQIDCANWDTAAFFKAARASDVTRCLEAGADPNVRDRSFFTPLHIVASVGNAEAVAALLEAGADLEARAGNGETPLHVAAAVGNAGAVAALANQGADLEARGRDGLTPLHRAAALGNAEAVTTLLEAGADPNARDEYSQTPLNFAATVGNAEAVAALLEAGADPNLRAVNGTTPLDYVDNEVVRALLEAAGAAPTPALGACANWNTAGVFDGAKLSDVARCLHQHRIERLGGAAMFGKGKDPFWQQAYTNLAS